ncbi:MAG: hypothetical protein M3373_08985 [Gemmatimonadota bacterium]|nr:hypothetical protein [Gemmatimonadota bacterium]
MTDHAPKPPQPGTPEAARYTSQRMVDWFSPGELVHSGIKALLSSTFGAYADRREMQAALNEPTVRDYSGESGDFWLDFVADLGDGWNSTYSVAYLMGRDTLDLPRYDANGKEKGRERTGRGRILVMGGDMVYPTATREAYEARLVAPYRAALPYVERDQPHLYAIPGNHDWYDGLTSYIRLFCQGRWIGGWKTQQSRSYFALRLPRGWWLWGTDVQLHSDIDDPQLRFFREVARDRVTADERIILVTAVPSWVWAGSGEAAAYENLAFFEREAIHRQGRTLAVTLTGDLHHYSRYVGADRSQQKITAGGGGAYLYPTHRLPREITLPRGEGKEDTDTTETYLLPQKEGGVDDEGDEALFPGRERSAGLVWGNVRFPVRNWRFGILLAAIYLLYAWLLQSGSKWISATGLMERLATLGVGEVAAARDAFVAALVHNPAGVVLSLVIVGGLLVFPRPATDQRRHKVTALLVGGAHGVLHVALCGTLLWLFAKLNLVWLPGWVEVPWARAGASATTDNLWHVLLFTVEMLAAGALAGGFLFGLYLIVAERTCALHVNEAFSSQYIEHWKNFLRLRIAESGELTIFPVGIKSVCTRWRLVPDARAGSPWYEPDEDDAEFLRRARLIESPIRCAAPPHAAAGAGRVSPARATPVPSAGRAAL